MKIRYFAWMREHTGVSSEDMRLPDGIETVGQLADYLKHTSEGAFHRIEEHEDRAGGD